MSHYSKSNGNNMRVMCVRIFDNPHPETAGRPEPFVGEICTVVDHVPVSDKMYYELSGRFHSDSLFRSDYFAPLSNIDELELVNEKELTAQL
jgi:hypothetical protein